MFIFLMVDGSRAMLFMLGIFSLFFIFMCVSFLTDQLDALSDNQTTVESHKY